jgi:ABC-type branched-subunit amino acid transport system permease subunit
MNPNLPQQGIAEGLPFLVILIVMTWRGRSLIPRGTITQPRYPSVGRPTAPFRTAAVTFVVGVVALVLLQGSLKSAFMSSIIWALLALSLVVLTGYVGQVSLAQLSFAGLSGFMLSHIALGWGVPFPISLLLAALCAVPLGCLIGLPALRVRGVNLAIVTLAAGSALEVFLFDNVSFSGGEAGRRIPSPSLLGIDLGIASGRDYPRTIFGVFILAVVVIVALLVARLRNSSTGRMLLAVRSNERAAAASGINVPRAKLLAFGISSFIAGLGGCLLGYQQGTLSPATFGVFQSLGLLAIAYVAGIGRISGAAVAGVMLAGTGLVVSALDKFLGLGIYQSVIAGVLLAFTAIMNPNGIATPITSGKSPANLLEGWGKRLVGTRSAAVPPACEPAPMSANGVSA